QRRLDCGPEIVDAKIYGRQRPPQCHDQRIVADRVDDRRQRAAMPLAGGLAALELRPHLAAHGDALLRRIGLGHLQPEEGDERGVVEHLLQLGIGQWFRLLAHGVTTILPNTSRSSITRSASRASSSLKVLSTSTLSL